MNTQQLKANIFNKQIDKYMNFNLTEQKQITNTESQDLANLGKGIPQNLIQTSKPCRTLMNNFIESGQTHQLRQFIECEKYMQFMNKYSNSNSI